MAKFYGTVGYGVPVETAPGVWADSITEVQYYGDVVRNTRQVVSGQKVDDDINVSNSISIVADPFAVQTFFAIRYVEWMGSLWIVTDVEVQIPRLLLRLGGVYNGPRPS